MRRVAPVSVSELDLSLATRVWIEGDRNIGHLPEFGEARWPSLGGNEPEFGGGADGFHARLDAELAQDG